MKNFKKYSSLAVLLFLPALYTSVFVFSPLPYCIAEEISNAAPRDMVLVQEGEFIMGANREEIRKMAVAAGAAPEWFADEPESKKVLVKSFYIDIYEVGNEEYKKFDTTHEFHSSLGDHPALFIDWEKADSFCKWKGKRLPTESEWEKAARGTDGGLYPWGNEFDPARANSQSSDSGSEARVGKYKIASSGLKEKPGTAPVTSFAEGKSRYGAYNMAGNVWEWVDGWYDEKKGLRMLKGGSWMSPAISLRAATRLLEAPKAQSNEYGFRCARDVGF